MDPENCSSDDGLDTVNLSDDVLHFFAKHYLKEQDCLALALSGSSHSFPNVYAEMNREQLEIGRCFFLTPSAWTRFFKESISHLSITSFDASHAYWLPADVLIQSTVQMTNLQELFVDDTKVSLFHLPKIFEACQKVVKLSFTLNENSLDQELIEKAPLDVLKKGFAKLTHLNMFHFITDDEGYDCCASETMDVEYFYTSWLRILQLLTWCRDCITLVINLAYPHYEIDGWFGFEVEVQMMFDEIESELLPLLGWMKNLKSLAILRHSGNYNPIPKRGTFFAMRLLNWLLPQLGSLERFWVTEGSEDKLNSPYLKSINVLNSPNLADDVLNGKRFANLEYIGGRNIDLNHLIGLYPHLKYVVGHCGDDLKALNEFCRLHPKLEQMFFQANIDDDNKTYEEEVWNLPLLRILGYLCNRPSKKIMQQVIKGCPNIEEIHLHIYKDRNEPIPIEFFSEFRLRHLRRLGITWLNDVILSNGSYLPQIFLQCPKLESLQFDGDDMGKPFFDQLTLCLPVAANLRDLRLEWRCIDDYDFSHLLHFMKALVLSSEKLPYFQRLVLLQSFRDIFPFLGVCAGRRPVNFAAFEKFIISFVKKMTRLVALGLFGFPFEYDAAEEIQRRLTKEIVPDREAFWFRVSDELPEENDTSVPRIHYYEIVAPNNPFVDPPKF